MEFFLDTYALIEIAQGNPSYHNFATEGAVTLKENIAEMYYFLLRQHGEGMAQFYFDLFSRLAIDVPLPAIPKAMHFRLDKKKSHFSYIDCLGYFTALEQKRTFVTGDRAFKGLAHTEVVR